MSRSQVLAEVDRQMAGVPLATGRLPKWQLLNSVAQYLSSPFVGEDFAFNGKFLNGATELSRAGSAVPSPPTSSLAKRWARNT